MQIQTEEMRRAWRRAMWQGRQRTFVRDPSDARHYYVRKGKDGVHIISSGSTIIIR